MLSQEGTRSGKPSLPSSGWRKKVRSEKRSSPSKSRRKGRGGGGEESIRLPWRTPRGEDQVGGGVTVEEKLSPGPLSMGHRRGRWRKVVFQSHAGGKGKEEGGGGGEDYPGSGGGGEEGEKGLQPLLDMEEGRLAEPVGGVVEGGERGGTHGQVKEGKVPLQVPLKVFQGRGCDQEELLGNLPKKVGEEVGQAALGGSEEGTLSPWRGYPLRRERMAWRRGRGVAKSP